MMDQLVGLAVSVGLVLFVRLTRESQKRGQTALQIGPISQSRLNLELVQFVGLAKFVSPKYEPRHEKTCLCHVRTTKMQISLYIHCLDSTYPKVQYSS